MPHRIQQWQSLGCPEHPIPPVVLDAACEILLQVAGLFKDNPNSYNSSYLNVNAGFYNVSPIFDPLSNLKQRRHHDADKLLRSGNGARGLKTASRIIPWSLSLPVLCMNSLGYVTNLSGCVWNVLPNFPQVLCGIEVPLEYFSHFVLTDFSGSQ